MATRLLPIFLAILLVSSSQQSCENTYGTKIDFHKEYLSAYELNCTDGMSVEFSDGTPSEECHHFIKPLTDSYHRHFWIPKHKPVHFILKFTRPITVSSLRMIDLFYNDVYPSTLDIETFVTFARNTEKERVIWTEAGLVEENSGARFHSLHFQSVTTDELRIEFLNSTRKIYLTYFEVNQLKESIQRNLLNLTTQANVTCSSNEDSCYRTHDGVYNENLGKSWKAGSGVHAQSLTIDLDQTYQFELARIFLSSFQCYNVVMNMSVSCNGVKWIFAQKIFRSRDKNFIVFPMYHLQTDSFTLTFDCYHGNGLLTLIKVLEMEFYGHSVLPTMPGTTTVATQTSSMPDTTTDNVTVTFPPAAQSIGGKLKVTSENYTSDLEDTASMAYKDKMNLYTDILFQAYKTVISTTSRIYNMTFTQGSIDTSYVADSLQKVTLTKDVKDNLTNSIVDTFSKYNIAVDPNSIDFTDLLGGTTTTTTAAPPNDEILAGILGAVATLLVISFVIAVVTVRMCLKSQRQQHDNGRQHMRGNEMNNNAPSSYHFPMFSSSQTSSNHSYPAFFSSSVRNAQVTMNHHRRPSTQPEALFEFPTPYQQQTSSFGRERIRNERSEDRNAPQGYIDDHSHSGDSRFKHRKRKKSQEYLERNDKTSITGYTPRRTEVPEQRPSRNIFDTPIDDEAYYSSDINYPYDGLHRNNSITLHRNRGHNEAFEMDFDDENHFHPYSRQGESQQRSTLGSDQYYNEGPGYQSPEHTHFHRDSLRVQGRRLHRHLSHESDQSSHHRSHAHGHTSLNEGVDDDALRPYYMAENHKPKGFFGRLSKKLSAPRIKKSDQNVHRQDPTYLQNKYSIA